jgi:tRNA G18 (ribose-2'-O)-methylase SpoU
MKIALLENIRSLHNVGSFFRTADAAGFDAVYLCGYTGCPPDRRIEKVSLGAENFITWEKKEEALKACQELKEKGFEIIAIEQTPQSEGLFDAVFEKENQAFIFGNEVEGVTQELLDISDRHIEIPMFGKKSSLNVSVAGGIVLYQARDTQK